MITYVTKDGDVCNQEELNSLYTQPYFCSARKAVGLDKLYILHIDCHWKSNQLAAALSNNSIHLTTTDTLDKISTFIVHEQHIIDIRDFYRNNIIERTLCYFGEKSGVVFDANIPTAKSGKLLGL